MHTKKICFLLLAALGIFLQSLRAQTPCPLTVEIAPPDTISCQNPTVQLQVNVDPPGNYFYSWSGPVQLPNIANPLTSTPGFYSVFVFDSTQCWGTDTVFVIQDGTIPLVSIQSNSPACDGITTLTATSTGNGPFEYAWSTGENTASIDVTASPTGSTFCVTVTDLQAGCAGAACFVLTVPGPLTATIFYSDSPFCNDSLGMWVNVFGGVPPYSFLWNTSSTAPWIPDPAAGVYVVTITDNRGCTAVATYVVENQPDECAHLQGYVLADWNNNCTKEASDEGLLNFVIRITNSTGSEFFTVSDADGFYHIELYPGAYDVAVVPPNALWDPCIPVFNVSLNPDQTLAQDFLLQAQAVCPAMSVDLGASFLRRCFNGFYSVSYCNQGTADAVGSYIDILFDPFLSVTEASIPYTSLGNNLYRFELGTVPFNSCGSIWVKVHVSCDAALGQTHCSEAVIHPTGNCEPANPQWSGASLQINVQCESDSLDFTIENIGSGDMSAPLEYVIIEDAVMLMQAPPPSIFLAPSEEYHIKVPANGSTWRVELEQEPFHPGASQPSAWAEGCTAGGQFSTGFVNQFPPDDNDPWVDIDCTQNTGAYDPNDKQGFPLGYAAQHYIEQNTDIEYLIRFQNTGTDTAFTVVIRDQLSSWLDPGSLKPGASSHPYTFEYYGDRDIKFTFENILLPDSAANLEGSQGFVSFRISQKPDVPLQTDILNEAGIFFDFNAPVYTNTTVHRVGHNFVSVSSWQPFRHGLALRIMPNPVAQSAVVELRGAPQLLEWQFELRDATGRPVRTATVNSAQWKFERGDLPAGWYMIQLRSGGQLLGAGKLMLK